MRHLRHVGVLAALAGLFLVNPSSPTGKPDGGSRGPVLGVLTPAVAAAAGPSTTAPPLHDAPGAPESRTLIPAPTAGLTYTTFDGVAFRPDANNDGSTNYVSGGGVSPAMYGWLYARVDVPQGARITELAWYVRDNSVASNLTLYLYRFDQSGGGGTPLSTTVTSGASTGIQTLTATPNELVDNTTGSYVLYVQVSTADANLTLYGVRLGYVDPTPGFHQITPARVYDSRLAAPYGNIGGSLGAAESRTVTVANLINGATGGLITANIVPSGATGIAYNLTIVSVQGSGWLSVYPADQPTSTTAYGSTINWSVAGQVLANGTQVRIDVNRQVWVTCGSGRTQFLIDVVGYYL